MGWVEARILGKTALQEITIIPFVSASTEVVLAYEATEIDLQHVRKCHRHIGRIFWVVEIVQSQL